MRSYSSRQPLWQKPYLQTIFEAGWAGHLTPVEYEAVRAKLRTERRLRTWWGFTHGNGKPSPETIAAVALLGLSDDRPWNQRLIRESRAKTLAARARVQNLGGDGSAT